MMNDLGNKIVLITGASSGIGAETAKVLATKNARIILLARSREKLEVVANQIIDNGGKAFYFSIDLSNSEAVTQLAQRIESEIGIPDIIINNAGVGKWMNIEETSTKEAQEMMALPYLAAFAVTKAFVTQMKQRGNGHIINLTSDASFLPKGEAIAYSSARYALRGFSEALRGYLLDTGITVSLAVFGKVSSSYWDNNPGSEERIPSKTPFMPTLTTTEVANYLLNIIRTKKRILIKPRIFNVLFWFYKKFPDILTKQMNK